MQRCRCSHPPMLLRAETAGAEGRERDIQGVPCSFPSTLRSDVPDIQYLSTFSTRTRTFDVSTSPCESKTRSWIKRDNFNFSLCEEHGTDGFLTGRRLFRTTFNFFFFFWLKRRKRGERCTKIGRKVAERASAVCYFLGRRSI